MPTSRTTAQRVRIKRQYEHELANPQEYAEMEAQLREWFPDIEIEEWADKTIIRWGRNTLQGHTRGEAIKGVWRDETQRQIRLTSDKIGKPLA